MRKINQVQLFFERLQMERDDIREDLKGLDLDLSTKSKIGDFACGKGYTTLSLMLELPSAICIGIDQFKKNIPLDVPSLDEVQKQFGEVKKNILSQNNWTREDGVKDDVFQLVNDGRFPEFQIGDIVTGVNLPSEFDFIYCKKLLQNVYDGGYGNLPKRDEGVKFAIEHIANSIKYRGLVCIVEPAGVDFRPFLELGGFKLIHCRRIERGDINRYSRVSLWKAQYLIYFYSKS